MRDRQLGEYLFACRGKAFDWRSNNCAHFAAGWVRLMTGIDAMSGLASTPSARAAVRVTRRIGATLAGAVHQRLGFEPCAPSEARVGDLVLVGNSLGICAGTQAAMLLDGGGIGFVPMTDATHAWSVA